MLVADPPLVTERGHCHPRRQLGNNENGSGSVQSKSKASKKKEKNWKLTKTSMNQCVPARELMVRKMVVSWIHLLCQIVSEMGKERLTIHGNPIECTAT